MLNLPIFLTANNLTPYLENDLIKRGEAVNSIQRRQLPKIKRHEKKWEGETNFPVFLSKNNRTLYLELDIQVWEGLIKF